MQFGAPITSGRLSYPSAMTPFPRTPTPCDMWKRQRKRRRRRARVSTVRILRKMKATAAFVILTK
jgi:hypothetical protein